jgi:hypothetical protein
MSDLLNTENKVNLLFKKFEGVAQTAIVFPGNPGRRFTQEAKKSLTNVFQQDIFSEHVPTDLSDSLYNMHFNVGGTWADSSWNTDVGDQTISAYDLSASPSAGGGEFPLRFYKKVYLEPTQTTSQAWWLRDPSGDGTGSSDNNLLRDMIPFLYNDLDPNMFTPIVEIYDSGTSTWVDQAQATPSKVNWVIDSATGILQLYQTTSSLSSQGVDQGAASSFEETRPRISFIKYKGSKGAAGTGGGGGDGTIRVGYNDASAQDVSSVYFDASGFDLSFSGTDVTVTNLGSTSGGNADLSYYFFDKPLAPTDGCGTLVTTSAVYIDLSWNNPPQSQSAVPLGLNYTYQSGSNHVVTQEAADKLPNFKELRVQYRQFSPDSSASLLDGWFDLSYLPTGTQDPLNRPQFPANSSFIPPTVNCVHVLGGTVGAASDLSNTTGGTITQPPYDLFSANLATGGGYQFRIFLTNTGTNTVQDPLYGGEASYNYLYIPAISGEFITLGSFGPPSQPTEIYFYNSSYNSLDISGYNDLSSCDASSVFPFPINPAYGLEVYYGFDISAETVLASRQMPTDRWSSLPLDSSYESLGTLQSSFTVDIEGIAKMRWAPETQYDVSGFYMRNNTDDFSNVRAYADPSGNDTIITGIPTRNDAQASTSPLSTTGMSTNHPNPGVPTDASYADAYPTTSTTLIDDVYFLKPGNPDLTFILTGLPSEFACNLDASYIGLDSSGVSVAYLQSDFSSNNLPSNSYETSGNVVVGYLKDTDMSITGGSSHVNIVATAAEGSSLAVDTWKGHGYYTDSTISSAQVLDVGLPVFPDICNNSYEKYCLRIQELVLDGATSTYQKQGGDATFRFAVAQRPGVDVVYAENAYTNPTVSLNNSFFGQRRPSPDLGTTPIDFSFNISKKDPFWRPSLTIARTSLYYRRGQTVPANNGGNSIVSAQTPATWTPDVSQNINPPVTYSALAWKEGSPNRQYSRAFSDASGAQFTIQVDYSNNVTWVPSTLQETRDVSFGLANRQMWWDYTWDGEAATGTTALDAETVGFFSGSQGSSRALLEVIPNNGPQDPPVPFDHTVDLCNNSLMWCNGAFRPGDLSGTLGQANPYLDYTASFYDPGFVLRDYSSKLTAGYSYGPLFTAGNWWANNSTTSSTSGVSGKLKFVTFQVNVPSGKGKFGLTITDVDNAAAQQVDPAGGSGDPDGYYVFHAEVLSGSATSYPTYGACYDGQLRYNAAAGFNSQGSFDPTSRSGAGIPTGFFYHIFNQTTGSSTTTLEISIGLANGRENSIKSIAVSFP